MQEKREVLSNQSLVYSTPQPAAQESAALRLRPTPNLGVFGWVSGFAGAAWATDLRDVNLGAGFACVNVSECVCLYR